MSAGAYSAEAAGGDLADHFRYGFADSTGGRNGLVKSFGWCFVV